MTTKTTKCSACRGNGKRSIPAGPGPYGEQSYYWGTCPTCHGKGHVPVLSPDDREMLDTVRRELGLK